MCYTFKNRQAKFKTSFIKGIQAQHMKIQRQYLYSVKFKVFSDHKSLKYLFDQKELNMRSRKQVEFLRDYDFTLKYHLGEANVVSDALSRKSIHMAMIMLREEKLIEDFRNLNLTVSLQPKCIILSELRIQNDHRKQIKEV